MTGLAGLVETPTTGPDAPRFEVTSVKRNQQGAGGDTNVRGLAGGAFRATNATLKMLICNAYRLMLTVEIVGGPSWADSYGFDVDARPPGDTTPDPAKLGLLPLPGNPGRRCGIGPDRDQVKAGSVTMATLIIDRTPMLDRPVLMKPA